MTSLLLSGLGILSAAPADAVTSCAVATATWDGGAGTTAWSDATNWAPDGVPGASDHVCIPSAAPATEVSVAGANVQSLESAKPLTVGGSLTLTSTTQSSRFGALTLSGTLAGAGARTVEGTFAWQTGTIAGPGQTTVSPTGTLDIVDVCAGCLNRYMDGGVLRTEGTGSVGSGYTALSNGATWENAGTLTLRDFATLYNYGGTSPTLRNTSTGLITKPAGAGSATIGVSLDNAGTVSVGAGVVVVSGGASTWSGTSTTAAGATTRLDGSGTLTTGAQFSGAGTVRIGGTLTATGPATFGAGLTVLVMGGTLGGAATRTVNGTLAWQTGTIAGPGQTTVSPTGTLDIVDVCAGCLNRYMDGGVLRTEGTGSVGSGYTALSNGATWENAGTLTLRDHATLYNYGGTSPTLRNTSTGLITKPVGAGGATIGVSLDNAGTVSVGAGVVAVSGGTTTWSGTAVNPGTGVLQLNAPGNLTGGTAVSAGTGSVHIGGGLVVTGPVTFAAGSNVVLTGGALGGPGARLVDGTLAWQSGTIAGPGQTTVSPTGTLDIVDVCAGCLNRYMDGGVLRTEGTGAVGSGYTAMSNGATWENAGTLTLRDHATLYNYGGVSPTLRNTSTGIITKPAGAGGVTIGVPFDNAGAISASAGKVHLTSAISNYTSASSRLDGGTWAASGTGGLQLSGVEVVTAGATLALTGAGTIKDAGNNDVLRNLATVTPLGGLTLRGGASLATPGQLVTAGTVTIGATSSLTTTGAYTQTAGSTTLESSSAALTATGAVVDIQGGTLAGLGTAGPSVQVGGIASPGLSPGTLSVSGPATVASTGAVAIELGASGPTDVLAASGPASIGGTLALSTLAGAAPAVGQSFTVLTAPSISGTFAGVTGSSPAPGKEYDVSYLPGSVQVTVAAVPGVDMAPAITTSTNPLAVGTPGRYSVSLTNGGGAPTSGTVTLVLTAGAGQSFTSVSGAGWACSGSGPVSCTRSSSIASGGAAPPVDVVVAVAAAAQPQSTMQAAVSGGGDTRPANDTFTLTTQARTFVPPVAVVSPIAPRGVAPFAVAFNGSASTGTVDSHEWDFGDGTTAVGATPSHTFAAPGLYTVTLRVRNPYQTDATSTRVTVVENVPLVALAGDDRSTTTGTVLTFDGSASQPVGDVDSFSWNFGDGAPAVTTAVASHTWAAVGDYTVTLTVTRAGVTATDTALVSVKPIPGSGLAVTVNGSGAGLPDAAVTVVDALGTRYQATTNGSGIGVVKGLADGSYSVYAFADGFLPSVSQATITGGAGTLTFNLSYGQVGTQVITSERLTYDEIVAAGIDPNDPANQHVYEFVICLSFDPAANCTATFSGIANQAGQLTGGSFGGGGGAGGSCTAVSCTLSVGGRDVEATIEFVDNRPTAVFLLIPGEARWLKEFFEVRMVVANMAPAGFSFVNGAASLDLPEGLALAPTSQPQSLVQNMADIPGGGQGAATWIVRGDTEGDYYLTASYTGSLDPVGRSISLEGRTRDPLKVWGSGALRMIVDADDAAQIDNPYRVRIGLRNVTGGPEATPVYNAAVELKKAGASNFIYQPNEQLTQGTPVILPGDTFWTDYYVLIPRLTGQLNVAGSFVFHTGGDTELASEIVSHPRSLPVPAITGAGQPGQAFLDWAPVVGATEYRVFRTPTPTTQFPDDAAPLVVTPNALTEAAVPAVAGEAWYAVGAVVGGKQTMFHPLIAVTALAPASAAGTFTALTPARILDTRDGTGSCTPSPCALVGPDATLGLAVAGAGGVPATGVSAVVMNVTVTQPTASSVLTVYPSDASRPTASNLNYSPGQTVPNAVTVKVGADGKVNVWNAFGTVHVIADVAGWYSDGTTAAASRYNAVTPARILDTRDATGTCTPSPCAVVGQDAAVGLQVAGAGGVPGSGATAVVMNVTVTGPTASSVLTAYPSGASRPTASNLNYSPGQTVPNLVTVKLGPDGKVDIWNAFGSTHVIADVAGWYGAAGATTGSRFIPVTPARILDTRDATGTCTPSPCAVVGPDATLGLAVAGAGGVPGTGVSAAVMNVTVTGPSAASVLTVYPSDASRPTASNLNYSPGQTVPNAVAVRVGADGKVNVWNAFGSTHVIADVAGWFSASGA